ncbi:hypothetical protein KUTeg_002436 [Tegillarca granosa]|uniref:Uncharacterized protein n=1 Tax=Tegillarca granosa TaxID=220873 RepID=A0ABQ9FUE2_TEGGR|nr:hypothetical protein KUTeg_002436 [Tegillarca granosa]
MDFKNTILYISGQRFYLDEKVLRLLPPSCFDHAVVNRHVECFNAILWFYTNGELHMPTSVCPSVFSKELSFWSVDPCFMSKCCYMKYVSFFDDQLLLQSFEGNEENPTEKCKIATSKHTKWKTIRDKGWNIMTHPTSSTAAKLYTLLSIFVILVSIVVLCLSTHPSFNRELNLNEWEKFYKGDDVKLRQIDQERIRRKDQASLKTIEKIMKKVEGCSKPAKPKTKECSKYKIKKYEKQLKRERQKLSKPTVNFTEILNDFDSNKEDALDLKNETARARYYFLDVIDNISFVYFAVELTLRFLFCPNKKRFFCDIMTVIDMIALLSEFFNILFSLLFPRERYSEYSLLHVLDCIQVVRVFRVFRIVKTSIGFRALIYSIKASLPNMALNMFMLLAAALIFAAVGFYSDHETFRSIPHAMWWAIVTLTTVGYGDVTPTSVLGRLVGCACAVSGVFVLAVLIPIFVKNYLLVCDFAKMNKHHSSHYSSNNGKLQAKMCNEATTLTTATSEQIEIKAMQTYC